MVGVSHVRPRAVYDVSWRPFLPSAHPLTLLSFFPIFAPLSFPSHSTLSVLEQVPLELPVQVVPHEPQEQVSDLPADVGLIQTQVRTLRAR